MKRRTQGITLLLMHAIIVAFINLECAQAREYTISLKPEDVAMHSPADSSEGKYYTFRLHVPSFIRKNTLERAILECYVDVSSREVSGYTNRTPVIEVYALKSEYAGVVDPSQFKKPSSAIRPIVVGDNRRVLLDIKPMVKSLIEDPSGNHGLIMGSLSGMREGDFILRSDAWTDGSVVRVHLFYKSQDKK